MRVTGFNLGIKTSGFYIVGIYFVFNKKKKHLFLSSFNEVIYKIRIYANIVQNITFCRTLYAKLLLL